jgi:hypothetical protein
MAILTLTVDSGSVSRTERFGFLFEAVFRGLSDLFMESLLMVKNQVAKLAFRINARIGHCVVRLHHFFLSIA